MEPKMAFEASARDRGSIEGFEAVLRKGCGAFSLPIFLSAGREKEIQIVNRL
jgi:hypothetical protein